MSLQRVIKMDERRKAKSMAILDSLGVLDAVGPSGKRMDANETLMVLRNLEEVRVEVIEYEFDAMHLEEMIPFEGTARGVETYVWRELTQLGVAELINLNTTDFPTVAAYTTENTARFWDDGIAYEYTQRDLERAAFQGIPLESRDAKMAKEAIYRKRETAGIVGLTEVNTKGLANGTGVPLVTSGLTGDWTNVATTSAQILTDANKFCYLIRSQTRGNHEATDFMLPTLAYQEMETRTYSTTIPDTILQVFRRNNPKITVSTFASLDTAGASSKPRAVAYEKSPLNMIFKWQIDFDQTAPQQRALKFSVYCRGAFSGTIIFRPFTLVYTDLLVTP